MKSPILHELKQHAPFTILGALSGIAVMAVCYKMPYKAAYNIFYIFHPMHIVLSALVTASMYKNYKCATGNRECNLLMLLVIGYVGSIGIATLSDSIIPYLGEVLLKLPHAEPHIGFIEKWWLVTILAGVGIGIAYFKPTTKFPHMGHVLISTWASSFHVIMAMGGRLEPLVYTPIFVFLFVAVWVPCCISDIVFPLLFVRNKNK